jgi:hypothetical protein
VGRNTTSPGARPSRRRSSRWAAELGVELPVKRHAGVFWTYGRLRDELVELTAGRTDWPSFSEFARMGREALYTQVRTKGLRDALAATSGCVSGAHSSRTLD